MKVSVLTITYRPGYIDTLKAALEAQTMACEQWEYILVDELFDERHKLVAEYMDNAFNFHHLCQEPSPLSATAQAVNLGLGHCQGELVYLMADYMYPHPQTLERHWEIYQRYGPKLLISGPLIDRITLAGKSIHWDAPSVIHTVSVGGRAVSYPEHSPPVEVDLKEGYLEPREDNLLSIFQRPFCPSWPASLPPDWRLGEISNISLAPGLYENISGTQWWWAGRNDSAGRKAIEEVGRMPLPQEIGRHAGMDAEMAQKMMEMGCRHLVDWQCPAWMLPHPSRKAEKSDF